MKTRNLLCAGILLLAFQAPSGAEEAAESLDSLIAQARALNPEIQVAALEAEAAEARIEGAGSLADPKVTFLVEGWQRDMPGYRPKSGWGGTDRTVRLSQELPFWGTLDLKRAIAETDARKARLLRRAVENDLVAQLKTAYADYHLTRQTIDLARGLRERLDLLARLAAARYGQIRGQRQEVTPAAVEASLLGTEIAALEAEKRKARARVNRLLGRDSATPLADDFQARPLPARGILDPSALSDRAQSSNPELLAQEAVIAGVDRSVALAEKNRYPNVEIGIGAMNREGRLDSYEAMITMNIPFQGGLRRSDIGAAKALSSAARQQDRARRLELDNAVADASAGLEAARQVETLIQGSVLPQAEAGFQSALKAYELDRADVQAVLDAERQLWRARIDLLTARADQQKRLADIERLVGEEL